jgi:hypothetical protein
LRQQTSTMSDSAIDAAEQHPAGYYRAASARARRAQDEATTPKIKQYLRELIERYDRLALAAGIEGTSDAVT